MERLGTVSKRSWGGLGASWSDLEASRGDLGAVLAAVGGTSKIIDFLCFSMFLKSRGILGVFLGCSWEILGRLLGGSWGAHGWFLRGSEVLEPGLNAPGSDLRCLSLFLSLVLKFSAL